MSDPKSSKEITELKQQWLADPCWDIEDTEGFEAHAQELKEFRREMEAEWAADRREKLAVYMQAVGLDPSLVAHQKLAERLRMLESRLAKLEDR